MDGLRPKAQVADRHAAALLGIVLEVGLAVRVRPPPARSGEPPERSASAGRLTGPGPGPRSRLVSGFTLSCERAPG